MLQRSLFDFASASTGTEPASLPDQTVSPCGVLYVQDAAGLRPATPVEIMEAGRRAADAYVPRGANLSQPRVVKDYFLAKLGGLQREVLGVIYLTNQLQFIAYEEPFGGTLNQCSAYPRELVKRGLELNAAAVILGHPHPSGNSQPSQADIAFTEALKKAFALVDIRLVDHVIVAGSDVLSLAERGLV